MQVHGGTNMGVFVRKATAGAVAAVTMALAATGVAQAAWSGSDSLVSGRYDHIATLLRAGRVLVAGGNNSGPLAIARVYDPSKNTWANAASMNSARSGDAAVRLDNGDGLGGGRGGPR